MSTIDPLVTDRLAAGGASEGIGFVDAPVGRLASHAERGESLFMVGAADETFARVKPLLEAMGTTIHHCGGVGAGMRTKLVNNYLAIVSCAVQRRGDRAVAAVRPHAREDARRHPRHDGDERPAQDRVAGQGAEGRHRARLHHRSRAQGPDADRRRGQRRERAGADRRRGARSVQRRAQPGARRARIFRRWSDVLCDLAGIAWPRLAS